LREKPQPKLMLKLMITFCWLASGVSDLFTLNLWFFFNVMLLLKKKA